MDYEKYMKKNYTNLCVNPFCFNFKLPDELGLCNVCFNNLIQIVGYHNIYDYSGKKPELKLTLKEALERLIDAGKGGGSFKRLRFEDDLCSFCKDGQKRTPKNLKNTNSNSQERR